MKKINFKINHLPAILWGETADKIIIAIHGKMSNKADLPIEILAKNATLKGYQVLSFDLPKHGDRINETTPFVVNYCVEELKTVISYSKVNWKQVSLFANSIGAYFSLLAYYEEKIDKAWFLSPLLDMERMIENMMVWFNISKEDLKEKKIIDTPIGEQLSWDYYGYVKKHPINKWKVPTYILYGKKDDMCQQGVLDEFAKRFSCQVEIVDSEHYFHTPQQLDILKTWFDEKIT